jgi:hypothetical protein
MLATKDTTAMGFPEVSTLLWREREALETLLYALLQEQLIVAAGQTRWLPRANDAVEVAVLQLRGTEILRAAEVEAVSSDLGTDLPTLAQLASAAGEPWATVFTEHREAMLGLVGEIEQVTDENRRLLAAGARAVRETLLSITQGVDTYDASGHAAPAVNGPVIMDEQA